MPSSALLLFKERATCTGCVPFPAIWAYESAALQLLLWSMWKWKEDQAWRWYHALPSPTPDPAQAHKDFCPDFLAGPTFCFSQLLGFLKPFTMDSTESLSCFNKFVFTCSPAWGVTTGIAQWTKAFLNFSWKGAMVPPQSQGQIAGMKSETKAE